MTGRQWVHLTTAGAAVPLKGKPTLTEMQTAVGGYVEWVPFIGGALWVNEDGRLRALPSNTLASYTLAACASGRDGRDRGPGENRFELACGSLVGIVGDALLEIGGSR